MIRAVLFDLGDTLVGFQQVDLLVAFAKAAHETYETLAHDFNQTLPTFKKYHNRQLRSLRWAYFKSHLTGREFNSVDVLRDCSRRMNINVPDECYEELAWQWYKPLADVARVDDDAIETLDELKRRGLKLAIVSNTFVPGAALDRQLEQTGLMPYFPVRVYSCQFGKRKPNPKIFAAALDRLGVAPEESMFIGDSYRIDVRGARRAGMFAVLKVSQPVTKRFHPKTFQVKTLAELPALVDEIDSRFFKPAACRTAV
jgi:HAD superfamily hydrolase (TIGR01549 family)